MDHLSFVEAVDRLGESVVVGIAGAANRRLDACLRERSVYFIETYWLPRSL
jgi:hypothetical protein